MTDAEKGQQATPVTDEESVDKATDEILQRAVGYDDICRLWRREQSVRLKVCIHGIEAVCSVIKVAEGELFDRVNLSDEVLRSCYGMLSLFRNEMSEILGRSWPSRPSLDSVGLELREGASE